MPSSRTALIAGASIAGPALAHWLSRYGWDVTVVERAPAPRTAGQNIDVRGVGAVVLERMGVRDAVAALRTGEVGASFIGPGGRVVGAFPADGSRVDGATAELEILRGDLSRVLVEPTAGQVEFVYGDRVVAVDDPGARGTPERATVHLESGQTRRADVVVAADGLSSGTREVLGFRSGVRYIGLESSYFTIARTAQDDDWWRWYNPGRGRSVQLRPDPYGGIRAVLSSLVPAAVAANAPRRSRSQQVAHLRAEFADAGWETARVLDGLDAAEDLYFEHLGQVKAPQWSRGRAVLVGDAAHCASPLSGMSTTLALTGAYVLAGELAAREDHTDAFAAYERRMRPFVEQAQKLPPFGPRLATPVTRFGVAAFAAAVRVISTRPLRTLGDRFASRPADAIDLPDYGHLLVR
ncbi:FAD-binding monooxygenase [Kineococcus sp. R8]|uniref:FAD-dependent monooxygenase n=1 Tax=Kineococcus siccus TaxID=2696567 RepID=UPI0014129862|nr:FAD-dependent monooxygenase [Kineococcus siccus]NAZ80792.1 FAD-binding monooxygenase [Kineococcus siccus]